MSSKQKILDTLYSGRRLCDDCLSDICGIRPRQAVNQTCRALLRENVISRFANTCEACTRMKIANALVLPASNSDRLKPPLSEVAQKTQKVKDIVLYKKNDELRRRINSFLQNAFDLPEDDYHARLDLNNLLSLKSALSDINNEVTMRLTLGFLDWATQVLSFDASSIEQVRATVLSTKPSSNGYDIHCTVHVPFVAEVKCNIPVNGGTKYGAAQKIGITKDIDALLHGKSKAFSVDQSSLKFMVFIDLPEVRAANNHLLASSSMASRAFRILDGNEVPNNPDVVYGVYAALGA